MRGSGRVLGVVAALVALAVAGFAAVIVAERPDAPAGVFAELVIGMPAASMPEDLSTPEARRFAEAAMAQVGVTVAYDPAYVALDYPGGDVPIETGVCTDVVVRAFRDVGVDLQVEVHEDMSAAFADYPDRWGLDAPDPNIDHRRVPNLETLFARSGIELPVTQDGADYQPGDIVTWSVEGRPHVGIVSTTPAAAGGRWRVVHNIGRGTRIEDRLFDFPITGHYRYF